MCQKGTRATAELASEAAVGYNDAAIDRQGSRRPFKMSDQVKLLLSFDLRPGQENAYRRFIMEEFLPQAQALGLIPTDAWHTAYGEYPVRLIGLAADDLARVRVARATDEWQGMMEKLEGYVLNLTVRVVPLRGGFQW
jgi:hypothetical protein